MPQLAVKETPDCLAVCTVVRAVTHRLHLMGGGAGNFRGRALAAPKLTGKSKAGAYCPFKGPLV